MRWAAFALVLWMLYEVAGALIVSNTVASVDADLWDKIAAAMSR